MVETSHLLTAFKHPKQSFTHVKSFLSHGNLAPLCAFSKEPHQMLPGNQADCNQQVTRSLAPSAKLEYICEERTPFTENHINPLYLLILFFIAVSTSLSNLSITLFVIL